MSGLSQYLHHHSKVFTPLQKGHVNKYLNNPSEVM